MKRVLPLILVLAACGGSAPAQTPSQEPASCRAPVQSFDWPPHARRRLREVRSDSIWLIQQVRERYADRLAAVEVGMPDRDPAKIRLLIRVTGHEPLPPMRLGHRAKGVPVVVEYGAPHSLEQVRAIRMDPRVQQRVRALLPDLQGEAYAETEGYILLQVYAPDDASARRALAQCGALRQAYGMPVRIEPLNARFGETLPTP